MPEASAGLGIGPGWDTQTLAVGALERSCLCCLSADPEQTQQLRLGRSCGPAFLGHPTSADQTLPSPYFSPGPEGPHHPTLSDSE